MRATLAVIFTALSIGMMGCATIGREEIRWSRGGWYYPATRETCWALFAPPDALLFGGVIEKPIAFIDLPFSLVFDTLLWPADYLDGNYGRPHVRPKVYARRFAGSWSGVAVVAPNNKSETMTLEVPKRGEGPWCVIVSGSIADGKAQEVSAELQQKELEFVMTNHGTRFVVHLEPGPKGTLIGRGGGTVRSRHETFRVELTRDKP